MAEPTRRASAATKVLKRACDQCHARKVKCDGHEPCRTCRKHATPCAFKNPVLPKGPRPRSGRSRRTSNASRDANISIPAASLGSQGATSSQSPPSQECPPDLASVPRNAWTSPQRHSSLLVDASGPAARNDLLEGISSSASNAPPQSSGLIQQTLQGLPTQLSNEIEPWQMGISTSPTVTDQATPAQSTSHITQAPSADWALNWQGAASSQLVENGENDLQLDKGKKRVAADEVFRGVKGPSTEVCQGGAPVGIQNVSWDNGDDARGEREQRQELDDGQGYELVTGSSMIPNPLPRMDDPQWDEVILQILAQRMPLPVNVGNNTLPRGSRTPNRQWRPLSPLPRQASPVSLLDSLPDIAFSTRDTPTFGQLYNNIPRQVYQVPSEDISPILTLTLETLIKPQIEIFFQRIHPMIPIFPPSYIYSRINDHDTMQDRGFVAMILSMTSLSLIHPLNADEIRQKQTRSKQAKALMDEACRLRGRWDYGSSATFEAVMMSYFMFGAMFELGHAAGARLRLKEAISLGEMMGLDNANMYVGLEPEEIRRRMRLYWVLAVTERAYALQRSGNIVFEGFISMNLSTITFGQVTTMGGDGDPLGQSLRYLAHIFSFVDQDIVACWNGRCNRGNCKTLTAPRIVDILSRLGASTSHVFGPDFDRQLADLTESQKADLLITWQWLKNRIWHLGGLHGLTREDAEPELSIQFVMDVAKTTVTICQGLSLPAMEAHGTGFVEKLYDIACLAPGLLQSDTGLQSRMLTSAQMSQWTDILQSLYSFVARHRQGNNDFAAPLAQAVSFVSSTRLLMLPSTSAHHRDK